MSYAAIQANVKTILAGLTRFAGLTAAIVEEDTSVLDRGYSEAIILAPGSFEGLEPQEISAGFDPLRYRVWNVLINIFERYSTNESATDAAFIALRDAVIAEIEQYPALRDASRMTDYLTLASDGDPADVNNAIGQGPFFKMQVLRLRVRETVYLETDDHAF
jgi:hypothetical protein